jgi:hypothetical protein
MLPVEGRPTLTARTPHKRDRNITAREVLKPLILSGSAAFVAFTTTLRVVLSRQQRTSR